MEAPVKSKCKRCGRGIYFDFAPDSGGPDWRHIDGMFGCPIPVGGVWGFAETNDPKPEPPPKVSPVFTTGLPPMVVKYYNAKAIENLKAQFVYKPGQIIPTYDPADYQIMEHAIKPVPKTDPPKKAFPKAVESPNGRKFRHEE